LGRNGSNYTASLVANYINAEELQNFTHVDGIYTNPELVLDAKRLNPCLIMKQMKLILEQCIRKTIIPLIGKKYSTSNSEYVQSQNNGTLITSNSNASVLKHCQF
jgi:aspartokinase